MNIYNTLSKIKEEFAPIDQNKVRMFVCGPTVYDYIHIGNARTFVFFDVVAKYLKFRGHDITYIQNITDIDNKIIERAQKEGANPLEYAKKYGDIFKEDMRALGVTSPEYKNATDHIPEVIKQVQTLLDKGNAYAIENDGIYFDLATFSDYGKLSGRTANMAEDAVSRIDDSDKKRNRGDFALWKFSQPGDPSWQAPFGEGRPGWHIEDTAITERYFGSQYDIHGGGQDLMFPHHEAEIAQQESASGLKPFVKYWMHAGFLINKDEKMSKSSGNFSALREVLKKYSPETLHYYFLSSHYRSPLSFDEQSLKAAEAAVQRISELKKILEIMDDQGRNIIKVNDIELLEYIKMAEKEFYSALDNDFNTPEALGNIFNIIRGINLPLRLKVISKEYAQPILEFLNKINLIFGIIPTHYESAPSDIIKLVEKREQLRKEEKWEESDKIRTQIEALGYKVDDTTYGPLIKKK
jgi:cysteinyl-tRNA synthetase